MIINEAYRFYETDCKLRRVSPDSLRLHQYCLKLLQKYPETKDIHLEKLTHLTIRKFLLWVGEGRSQTTVSRIYDVLSALFSFLEREEIWETNPMRKVSKPKATAKLIEPLSVDEVSTLLATCDTKTFPGIRNKLIVALLFDTGMRASELTNLDLSDIDLEQYAILIRHGKGDKPRTVYFGLEVAKLMRRYLAKRGNQRHDKLIVTSQGDPTDRYWLNRMMSRLGKKAGVKANPHLFRHSCGVAMLRNGADVFTVQKLLGHSTLMMTRHYSQLADRDVQEKHRLYSPSDRLRKTG
jgi:integrase/recombinase XerD